MLKLNWFDWLVMILVVVGGLNWGLVAVGWNLVDSIFGASSSGSMVVYGLVGLASLYMIFVTMMKVGKANKMTM